MRGNVGRLALAGAFVCALLAAWFNLRVLEMQQERVEVLTVATEVQPYTAIGEQAVRTALVPRDAVPPDAITDPAALAGRYTRALLVPGTILREGHLVPGGGSNLAARLAAASSPDVRAMALQVDEATGVAGTLREGDPVDILVAIHADVAESAGPGLGRTPQGTWARIIAHRVPVLYVRRDDMGGPAAVVLQVTPQTAEEIAFAQANGKIWLLTGPYGSDVAPAATTGVDRQVFFERYGIGQNGEGAGQQIGASRPEVSGDAAGSQVLGNPADLAAPIAGLVGGE